MVFAAMQRETPVSIRLPSDVKAALMKAAKADDRSISKYVERVLIEHLRKAGFLKAPK